MTESPDGTTGGPPPHAAPETVAAPNAPPEPVATPAEAASGPAAPGVAEAAPRRRLIGPLQVAVAAVAVLAGAALFLSGFSLGARTATTPGTPASETGLFGPFWDVWDSITRSYVGEVDKQKVVQGAIDGMIGALDDPYSAYMSPEELRQARESIGGEFSGVGAEVSTEPTEEGAETCDTLGPTCRLVVVAPMDGSPAERAGLRAGDVIAAVDGDTMEGKTLDEAVQRIRGPKGTEVTLSIVRDGGAPFDLAIVRDTIVQRQVETRDLADGEVTYIRLTGFSDNAAAQFDEALRAAREKGVDSFIVDLRDNPGGLITAARSVASQFVAEGPIFWEEDADGAQVSTDAEAGGAATDEAVRVAVLVNGGTASASEIVAGALQDAGRGTLVGQTTYGKGTVQQWVDLSAESGGFRLSIAKWLTPAKRWIHRTGLAPDVVVPADGGGSAPTVTGDPFIDAALDLLDGGSALGPPSTHRAAA